MVALCSKTYYCWDSEGRDKLSSKGLQKVTNADGLAYKAYRRVQYSGHCGGHAGDPPQIWWVPGSHTSSIFMTYLSFIWYRISLTKTPVTGPSASMPLTSSCSRTPGTCPRSPTWTSKCIPAAMASWQLPTRTPQSCVPPATWCWLQPDNAWEILPAQHPASWWGISSGDRLQACLLGLRKWGGQSEQRQQKCQPWVNVYMLSQEAFDHGIIVGEAVLSGIHWSVAWQLHHHNHSEFKMPGLTPSCDSLQRS